MNATNVAVSSIWRYECVAGGITRVATRSVRSEPLPLGGDRRPQVKKMGRNDYVRRSIACAILRRMDHFFARALSAIVRSELGRAGMTADAAQKAIGISSAAWRNYFTNQKRDVPSRVLLALADLFEMPASRLVALAEAEEARLRLRADDPLTPQTQKGRDNVAEGRAELPDPPANPGEERGRATG